MKTFPCSLSWHTKLLAVVTLKCEASGLLARGVDIYLGRADKQSTQQVRLTDAAAAADGAGGCHDALFQVKHWNARAEHLGEVMQQNQAVTQHVRWHALHVPTPQRRARFTQIYLNDTATATTPV